MVVEREWRVGDVSSPSQPLPNSLITWHLEGALVLITRLQQTTCTLKQQPETSLGSSAQVQLERCEFRKRKHRQREIAASALFRRLWSGSYFTAGYSFLCRHIQTELSTLLKRDPNSIRSLVTLSVCSAVNSSRKLCKLLLGKSIKFPDKYF